MVKVLLISTPAPQVRQYDIEKEYWKWHFALKTKLTYTNLNEIQLQNIGNVENQNIGLLSIASCLLENGVDVSYIAPSLAYRGEDREQKFLKDIIDKIVEVRPQFVGFSSFTCSLPITISYAATIKNMNSGIKTVIGGAHANGVSSDLLKELAENFDYIIRGRGEIPFLKLVLGERNIQGLSFKEGDVIIESPICMDFLSGYPKPANDLLNIGQLPAARVFTSLGCRIGKKCIFCADINNRKLIQIPADAIKEEIKFLYYNLGTRYFYLGDENFFFDKERAYNVLNIISSLDLDIIIGMQSRLESIDEELINKVAECGNCTQIEFGIESASQKLLNIARKGLKINKVRDICKLIKGYGINTHCYFLVGLPGETHETAENTIKMIEEFMNEGLIDTVEYRCVVPFPSTPMWNDSKKYGVKIKSMNWERYRGENIPVFDLDKLTGEEIYEIYLNGLARISKLYQNRYLKQFGDSTSNIGWLTEVTDGGF